MKVITFFNEKGGVGKTTLTALFASWLAYGMRQEVRVMDCDYPSYQLWNMQQRDVKALREGMRDRYIGQSLAQMCAGNEYYNVGKMVGRDIYSQAELEAIVDHVAKLRSARGGYMLMDFPGRFLPSDPVTWLSAKGQLDLVVFPVDSDRQSFASALATHAKMREYGQRCAVLLNRETAVERKSKTDRYAMAAAEFGRLGVPVIGTRVREMLIARRDSTSQGFIRNTLCWPQQNIDRACPWIVDAFAEIRSLADGAPRLKKQGE